MNDITVDKGVEMPSYKSGQNSKYPFGTMEHGDSFLVAFTDDERLNAVNERSLRQAASNMNKKVPAKFAVRTVVGGLRCWKFDREEQGAPQ